jgi:hypothetical protein
VFSPDELETLFRTSWNKVDHRVIEAAGTALAVKFRLWENAAWFVHWFVYTYISQGHEYTRYTATR